MADEDTPVEDIEDIEDTEDSEDSAGAEGAGDAVDSADSEDAGNTEDSEDAEDGGDTPLEDTAAGGPSENAAASEIKPSSERAKVAALVAGAMLAGAAAIVGAVWAITAITDDDYPDDYAVPYNGEWYYEESVAPEWFRRDEFDRERRADRDQRWHFDRDRGEHFDRDSGKRTGRDKYEHKDSDRQESSEGSEPSKPAAEECWTIHRFGSGEHAVTVLVCKAPGAEWPEFEPGDEGGYFRFRKLPKDAFPFFGMGGDQWPFLGRQRPFGPGRMPWDRDGGPFEDGWPFRDGWHREGEPRFDLEEFFEEFFRGEQFGEDGLPFDLEEFFGDGVPFGLEEFFGEELPFDLEEFFEGERFSGDEPPFDLEEFLEERPDRGDRGFRFRGDGTGDGLCFQLGEGQEECIADLDQLSDEELAQLEQMLEMLENFGLGDFFGGLLDSLDGLEFEFPESQTDPAGATSA